MTAGRSRCASRSPDPELIRRLDAAGVDEFTRSRVLKRHDKRWKEWYGESCPPVRTACAAPDVPLPSKWNDLLEATPVVDIGADGLVVRRGELDVPPSGRPPETADNFDTGGSAADNVYERRALELREVKLEDGASVVGDVARGRRRHAQAGLRRHRHRLGDLHRRAQLRAEQRLRPPGRPGAAGGDRRSAPRGRRR